MGNVSDHNIGILRTKIEFEFKRELFLKYRALFVGFQRNYPLHIFKYICNLQIQYECYLKEVW